MYTNEMEGKIELKVKIKEVVLRQAIFDSGQTMDDLIDETSYQEASEKVNNPKDKYYPVLQEPDPKNGLVMEFLRHTRLIDDEYLNAVRSVMHLSEEASQAEIAVASAGYENYRRENIDRAELERYLTEKIQSSKKKELISCLWRLCKYSYTSLFQR